MKIDRNRISEMEIGEYNLKMDKTKISQKHELEQNCFV